MKIDCTSNNGGPCLNCEAYVAGHADADERVKRMAAFAQDNASGWGKVVRERDDARVALACMHRRAQKAESAIRAVERRAEGMCRDAERRVTEEARVRGLYRKEMRDAADLIRKSGLVQCETPARDGWPRVVEGRLEVLVPRLIAECERLRAEVARLSGRTSYDDVMKASEEDGR